MSANLPISELIERYLDDTAEPAEIDQLQRQLCDSDKAADAFVEEALFDALLVAKLTTKNKSSGLGIPIEPFPGDTDLVHRPSDKSSSQGFSDNEQCAATSTIPPIVVAQSTASFSSMGSYLFSYAAGAALLGFVLLIGWAWKIQLDRQAEIAVVPPSSIQDGIPATPQQLIGRITALADCQGHRWSVATGQWSEITNHQLEVAYHHFSVGDRFNLASGLMEITYNTGAKLILQGPCRYEVDSTHSGLLAVGKLTALVEKKAESTNPSPLFAVRTPTAVVTDLGTEFGVEVTDEGTTMSHVFRGSIRVQLASQKRSGPHDIVLIKGESAQVAGNSGSGYRLVPPSDIKKVPFFVRRLDRPFLLFDLVTYIAGRQTADSAHSRGGGTSLWIKPNAENTPLEQEQLHPNLARYQRPPAAYKLVDGAFIPDQHGGMVKLDSAGHCFNQFGHLSTAVTSIIWARGPETKGFQSTNDDLNEFYYRLRNERQFMPEKRGLLGFYASAGITFDMEVVRQSNPTMQPVSFRAVAGLPETSDAKASSQNTTDIWVFVDGQLRFHQAKIHSQDGGFPVKVRIYPHDRFLTLVATENGSADESHWSVFGDPVLKLIPVNSNGRPLVRPNVDVQRN